MDVQEHGFNNYEHTLVLLNKSASFVSMDRKGQHNHRIIKWSIKDMWQFSGKARFI